jgi:hypothetical protein
MTTIAIDEYVYELIVTNGAKTATLISCPTHTSIVVVNNISSSITVTNDNRSGLNTSITNGNYTVTKIGDNAFNGFNSASFDAGCGSLTSVTIPNSVTSIGEGAFNGCESLTSLTLPNTLTSIGIAAFQDCNKLISLTLPNTLTSIGNKAFQRCMALISLTIPNNVTTIGNTAFNGCSALTNLTLTNSLTYIGGGAFGSCNALPSLTLPDSLTTIEEFAFGDCWVLTSLTLPDTLRSIGNGVFKNCWVLTSLILPKNLTTIGVIAFFNCTALLSVIIPKTVTTIGENAFTKENPDLLKTTGILYKKGLYKSEDHTDTDTGLEFKYSSASSGDPYITTFYGLKYKLPNILRTYRLLEYPVNGNTLYINATVSELSPTEKLDIENTATKHNLTHSILNGFFYEKFFIGSKNIDGTITYAILDRQLDLIEYSNLNNYQLELQDKPQVFECEIQGKSNYKAKIISVGDVRIELRKYSNPQILNGIDVSVSNPNKANGILSSNINPKNFMVKTIDNMSNIIIKNTKEYNKEVKEIWIKTN